MRRIVMFNWGTADGYFAGPDGNLESVVPDDEQAKAAAEGIPRFDTVLFGRVTYELFEGFWRHAVEDAATAPDPHRPGQRSREHRAIAVWLNETSGTRSGSMAQAFKDLRKRAYFNPDGADKPLRSPIPRSTLIKARGYRRRRLVDELHKRDCAAILLYDPVNIRYAFDVSNMQLWMTHNASHYAVLCADGRGIDFEYRGAEHLAHGLETIDEVRSAVSWFYFTSGPRLSERLASWADEIADIVREHGGAGHMRLAVDKMEPAGVDALRARGVVIVEGQEITEHARCIKSLEELELIKWTIRVCEAGVARRYECSVPGTTESAAISVACGAGQRVSPASGSAAEVMPDAQRARAEWSLEGEPG